jgi:dihydroflavonol-4-reductase
MYESRVQHGPRSMLYIETRMLAFVTGATGFVGSHVARALAEQGADLRLLVRSNSNLKNIQDFKADLIIGDLSDPTSLER